MITVEELDGNWRIYRWSHDGFLCYVRKRQSNSRYHICAEAPGLFSLNNVYDACVKSSIGMGYDWKGYNCNKWTEAVMRHLTGQACFKAKTWAKCRLPMSHFMSCSDTSQIASIQP